MDFILKQRVGTIFKRNAAYLTNQITDKCSFVIINTKIPTYSLTESDWKDPCIGRDIFLKISFDSGLGCLAVYQRDDIFYGYTQYPNKILFDD